MATQKAKENPASRNKKLVLWILTHGIVRNAGIELNTNQRIQMPYVVVRYQTFQ